MTRWPNSSPPGVQPYNDQVLADLEDVLRQVVGLGDRLGIAAVELIEEYRAYAFGDGDLVARPVTLQDVQELNLILEPHTTEEFDAEDLTYELLELIGDDAADDLHND